MIIKGKNFTQKIRVCTKSMEEILTDCKSWAEEICKTYKPDLIIFIAKSGFLFAKPMAEVMECEMADIIAVRPANSKKDRFSKLIKYMPEKIVLEVLRSPFMYKFNERKKERDVRITKKFEEEKHKRHKKILIVDDSVDTGWTLQKVVTTVGETFPGTEIKTASYSVIQYSKHRIKVDYFRYMDVIVLTATSRKSKEYKKFLNLYNNWVENIDNDDCEC